MFYVLYQFVIYLLTLARSTVDIKQFDFAVKFIHSFGNKTGQYEYRGEVLTVM
jgi:hypothetical protein